MIGDLIKVGELVDSFDGWFKAAHIGGRLSKYSDRQFLVDQIKQLPPSLRWQVMDRYSSEYKLIARKNGEQDARTRANIWLRKVVERGKAAQVSAKAG